MKPETTPPADQSAQLVAAPEAQGSLAVLMSPHYSARRIEIVVAVANSNLRSTSEKTTEVLKRMLVTLSMTAEMVAWSRAAIDSSRCLLNTNSHRARPALGKLEPRRHDASLVRSDN